MSCEGCRCVTHPADVPHWRHQSDLWKARNREMLATALDESVTEMVQGVPRRWLAWLGCLAEEGARLKLLEDDMRAHGVGA